MTDTLNAHDLLTAALADSPPDPDKPVAYRLTISHGIFGVPEPLKLDGDLPLSIGDEVHALVRIRITGRSEREATSKYDEHTVTTDAKIVEFIEVDGKPLPAPEPAKPTVTTSRRQRTADRALYLVFGAALTVSLLSVIQGLITAARH
jgi:hypothetical protein